LVYYEKLNFSLKFSYASRGDSLDGLMHSQFDKIINLLF
jgi:hypothetical protein